MVLCENMNKSSMKLKPYASYQIHWLFHDQTLYYICIHTCMKTWFWILFTKWISKQTKHYWHIHTQLPHSLFVLGGVVPVQRRTPKGEDVIHRMHQQNPTVTRQDDSPTLNQCGQWQEHCISSSSSSSSSNSCVPSDTTVDDFLLLLSMLLLLL